jgi:hypothetical protein
MRFDDGDGSLAQRALPAPTDDEVEAVAISIVGAVLRLVARADDRADDEPAMLEALAGAAGVAPPTARPHNGGRGDDAGTRRKRRAALIQTELGVFSIHAATSAAAGDRDGLERLLRYGGRPPLSHKRLSITAAGKVCYRQRLPYHTGQTDVVLEPVAFLRRLAALVPPKRKIRSGTTACWPPRPTIATAWLPLFRTPSTSPAVVLARGSRLATPEMAPIRRPVPTRPRRQPAPTIACAGQSFWPAYSSTTCCCAATAASAQR